MKRYLLVTLIITFALPRGVSQNNPSSVAKLVRHFEYGCGTECARELAINVGEYGRDASNIVAIRFCSKEPLPKALVMAAASPETVIDILTGSYNYTPDRILLLRSDDCMNSDSSLTIAEYWFIPKGAPLPTSVESIKSCQVQFGSLGLRNMFNRSRNFRTALRKLPERLNASPESIGIVLGYYLNHPSPTLKRELNEAERFLRQSGLSSERYFVHLMRWVGEYQSDPPEPELQHPNISIIKVLENCEVR